MDTRTAPSRRVRNPGCPPAWAPDRASPQAAADPAARTAARRSRGRPRPAARRARDRQSRGWTESRAGGRHRAGPVVLKVLRVPTVPMVRVLIVLAVLTVPRAPLAPLAPLAPAPLAPLSPLAPLALRSRSEGQIYCARHSKPDEPRVVVDGTHDRNHEAAPGGGAAEDGRDDARHVPAVRVAICAVGKIQILEAELLLAHDPVVRDQHTSDRSKSAGIAEQPREDVAGWIGEQPPGLDDDPDDPGDQAARLEADEPRKRVGEVVRGRD